MPADEDEGDGGDGDDDGAGIGRLLPKFGDDDDIPPTDPGFKGIALAGEPKADGAEECDGDDEDIGDGVAETATRPC